MHILCVACGEHHNLMPTAMRYALLAFQKGDAQHVTKEGIVPICIATARLAGYLGEEDDAPDAA